MVITAGFSFFLTIRLLVVDIFVDRKKPLNISFSGIFLYCQQRYLKKINIVIRRKDFGTDIILIKVSSALLTLTAGIKSQIEILSRRGKNNCPLSFGHIRKEKHLWKIEIQFWMQKKKIRIMKRKLVTPVIRSITSSIKTLR